MSHNIVADANIWIRFARAKNIYPLVERFELYEIIPYANNYLLSEIFDALIENNWADARTATSIVEVVRKFCQKSYESAIFRLSPDYKDNYLFDLAIQNNCEFILSDDSVLLNFPLKPVPVKSCNWFLKHFPL